MVQHMKALMADEAYREHGQSQVSLRNAGRSFTMKSPVNTKFDFLNSILAEVDKADRRDDDSCSVKIINDIYLYDSRETNALKLKSTHQNATKLENTLDYLFPKSTLEKLREANTIKVNLFENWNKNAYNQYFYDQQQ